ncbi:DUF5110 domain-containing protein [Prolixibacteraceae bacterium JC049]|nr:DUF5110 domain-containing protein [Prolixibacteraceae bacterium JC049]
MKLLHLVVAFGLLASCGSKTTKIKSERFHPTWEKTHSGVYTTKVNEPADFNLLSVNSHSTKGEAINKIAEAPIPIDQSEIDVFTKNGKTYLRFPLDKEEQIYGLGLNFKTVQQRGRIMRLHMDHYGGRDNGRTHAPVPFFISSKGYGVFINAARYIDVYIGTGVTKDSKNPAVTRDRNTDRGWSSRPYSDNLEIVVPENGVEMVMFTGKSMMDVVRRFNLYCGGGIIPPKWGLGFWQRTPTRYSDKDVKNEIAGFEKNNFPIDVLGLEPGWHSKAYPCTFEWDKGRFPNPGQLMKDGLNDGVRFNLWLNPYIWPDSNLDKKMANYTGSHTVWCGTVPDYTMPEARQTMKDHFKKHQLNIGVSGFKVDEVDGFDHWIWPDFATFPSGKDGEQMRQTYGNQFMRLTDEMYREKNERTYGLIRAANAGSVAYPYVIYNDYYSHRDFITALINSGFNGVLWTPEVRAGKSEEEWVRRMQTVCFSPMAMINAWADGTKPWSFPKVYKACQDVAFLRMQLLPYIYSTFAQYHFEGTPPFRAVNLIEGFNSTLKAENKKLDSTKNPYNEAVKREIKDQYMMGDNMLVAPIFTGEKERRVVLPKGKWFDFYTGKLVGEGEVVTVKAELDKIPVFVKDGGIIPMMKSIRQTKEWTNNMPLEVRVYGKADGEFTLYDDDGKSFDFEKGKYTMKQFVVKNGKGSVKDIHTKGPWSYGAVKWTFMTK